MSFNPDYIPDFNDKQAAEAIQDQITPRALANNIIFQYDNPAKRADAEAKMKALAIPDAASRVAALVESLCGGGR